jgi:hypothetical protein
MIPYQGSKKPDQQQRTDLDPTPVPDPDPALFVGNFEDGNNNKIFILFFLRTLPSVGTYQSSKITNN